MENETRTEESKVIVSIGYRNQMVDNYLEVTGIDNGVLTLSEALSVLILSLQEQVGPRPELDTISCMLDLLRNKFDNLLWGNPQSV